jgi:xanthine permease XanP
MISARLVAGIAGFMSRSRDRRMERPPGLAYWLDGKPNVFASLVLAFQQQAIQSVYYILPVAVAGSITRDPAEVTRFLCLSILAAAIWQALQILTKGPIGSGYPIAGTHTAACLSAYMLTSSGGGGFHAIAAMVCVMGAASFALTFLTQRLRVVLPNEVAGVVVVLIGVALIRLGAMQLGLQPGGTPRGITTFVIVGVSMLVMTVVALSNTRFAPFAVLIGAKVGVVLSLLVGESEPHAWEFVASQPWVDIPHPWLPHFNEISTTPMVAFLLALVATQATAAGDLVMMQRSSDATWTKPDGPPLDRGLLANAVGVIAAGLIGGAAPGPSTAGVGLSIATGTLARRIIWFSVLIMVVMAFSPKVMAMFVLMPAAANAAMLLYVAGFIMAQGCQLATARLLDMRRMMVVAFGLSGGMLVMVSPHVFESNFPSLASPLALGALVAFVMNLVTLPLVAQRAHISLLLDMQAGRHASEWIGRLAGSWGLKRATAQAAERAIVELTELLMGRHVAKLDLRSTRTEDRIELDLIWAGTPLPEPTNAPSPEDLLGTVESQEQFMVWLAIRGAHRFSQRATHAGCEARLIFED